MQFNPTGMYRREFTIRPEWKRKRIILYVGAVKSNLMVWVNGSYVGYGTDSKLSSEFDITPFLRPNGKNLVAMKVMRWEVSNYLEDQDMWRLSGIQRDCYLLAQNPLHIENVVLNPELDSTYCNGSLAVQLSLNRLSEKSKVGVEVVLKDGQTVLSGKRRIWIE